MQLSAGRSLTRTAAGTHQALVAKLGEVSLDCCHWYSHLSEEKKSSSLLSSTQADVLLFFFVTKIFSSSSSYTSALQPHCFCQSGGQMFALKSGGMRNRLKGKWITEEIVFLSWHLYFLIQGSGNSVLSLRTSVCMKYYSTHLSPGRRGCAGVMWC